MINHKKHGKEAEHKHKTKRSSSRYTKAIMIVKKVTHSLNSTLEHEKQFALCVMLQEQVEAQG